MNILAQESSKSQLWFKRYEGLNLQGLNCKIVESRTEFISKARTKLEFSKNIGGFVQGFGINCFLYLYLLIPVWFLALNTSHPSTPSD
jgi:hypothetical protein